MVELLLVEVDWMKKKVKREQKKKGEQGLQVFAFKCFPRVPSKWDMGGLYPGIQK